MQASVKVMRSYDYCHFEVALSEELDKLESVDDLRKQAAILVDEAVRQYKIAKAKEGQREASEYQKQSFLAQIERIKEKPESELTVQDAALMRSHADREFWKQYDEEDYYYQESERDYHFSMLRKFQNTRISASPQPAGEPTRA